MTDMQQVNLYIDEFKHIEPAFSARSIRNYGLYSLLLGLLVSGILALMSWWVESNLDERQMAASKINAELEDVRNLYPEPKVDSRYLNQIDVLKQKKLRNDNVLQYLSSRQIEAEYQSFSTFLLALSVIKEKNLWLTHIKIFESGKALMLTGRALEADSVPRYFEKLTEVSVFADMDFKVFDLTRDNDGLKFVISSKREEVELETLLDKLTGSR